MIVHQSKIKKVGEKFEATLTVRLDNGRLTPFTARAETAKAAIEKAMSDAAIADVAIETE